MTETPKTYDFWPPVHKKGDDLHHQLKQHPDNTPAALEAQAKCYDEAARMCRRLGGVIAENPKDSIIVNAQAHSIWVQGPEAALAGLISDGVLTFDEERWAEEEVAKVEQTRRHFENDLRSDYLEEDDENDGLATDQD